MAMDKARVALMGFPALHRKPMNLKGTNMHSQSCKVQNYKMQGPCAWPQGFGCGGGTAPTKGFVIEVAVTDQKTQNGEKFNPFGCP